MKFLNLFDEFFLGAYINMSRINCCNDIRTTSLPSSGNSTTETSSIFGIKIQMSRARFERKSTKCKIRSGKEPSVEFRYLNAGFQINPCPNQSLEYRHTSSKLSTKSYNPATVVMNRRVLKSLIITTFA